MFVVLFVILSLVSASSTEAAQRSRDTRSWYVAYDDAKKAITARNWQKALDDIQVAVNLGPKPGRSVPTYGDGVVKFAPDYYKGVALLGLKRFSEAEAAFEAVRTSGLIAPKDSEYSTFVQQADTAAFENLLGQAEQSMTRQQLDQAKQFAAAAGKHAGADVKRVESLMGKIDNAIRQAAAAAPKPTTPDPTPPPANPPTNPTGPTNPPAGSGTNPNPGDTTVKPTNPPVDPNPPSGNPSGGRSGTNVPPTTPANPPPTSRPAPGPTPAPAPPSYAEEQAIELYFSGQYADAAGALTTMADNRTATPRAFFYLACSRAAMVLMGMDGESGLARARAALGSAGNTAQFAADLRLISPRVQVTLGLGR